jgi:hypothetical protein
MKLAVHTYFSEVPQQECTMELKATMAVFSHVSLIYLSQSSSHLKPRHGSGG